MADRRLQVFHAVAKQMSFTKAAETLFMTQPAVTFQIKQLEERFNMRLFERGRGKIALTPAGEVVLEYADRIMALSAELETRLREMTKQLAGPLLIGASTTIAEFLLPRVLGEFKTLHPEVQPKLNVGDSETIESRVAEHTLDVGLIEAPSPALPAHRNVLRRRVAGDRHPAPSAREAEEGRPQAARAVPIRQPRSRVRHTRVHRPLFS